MDDTERPAIADLERPELGVEYCERRVRELEADFASTHSARSRILALMMAEMAEALRRERG